MSGYRVVWTLQRGCLGDGEVVVDETIAARVRTLDQRVLRECERERDHPIRRKQVQQLELDCAIYYRRQA